MLTTLSSIRSALHRERRALQAEINDSVAALLQLLDRAGAALVERLAFTLPVALRLPVVAREPIERLLGDLVGQQDLGDLRVRLDLEVYILVNAGVDGLAERLAFPSAELGRRPGGLRIPVARPRLGVALFIFLLLLACDFTLVEVVGVRIGGFLWRIR